MYQSNQEFCDGHPRKAPFVAGIHPRPEGHLPDKGLRQSGPTTSPTLPLRLQHRRRSTPAPVSMRVSTWSDRRSPSGGYDGRRGSEINRGVSAAASRPAPTEAAARSGALAPPHTAATPVEARLAGPILAGLAVTSKDDFSMQELKQRSDNRFETEKSYENHAARLAMTRLCATTNHETILSPSSRHFQ